MRLWERQTTRVTLTACQFFPSLKPKRRAEPFSPGRHVRWPATGHRLKVRTGLPMRLTTISRTTRNAAKRFRPPFPQQTFTSVPLCLPQTQSS